MKTDFIVIGSGLAGLTSSLVLSKYGKVLLITKGKLSDGATNWAQGGIACAVLPDDSWQEHYKDTLIAGAYHNDKKAVEFLVKQAPAAIDWLSKQGVIFEKTSGIYKTGREGGHSYNRIIHATDFTGKEIELALTKRVRTNRNIKIWEYAFAKKLLVEDRRCIGVEVIYCHCRLDRHSTRIPDQVGDDKVINIFSQAVVLATGGMGQIYQWTTNPYVSTGDGISLAYRAGARLQDMEFIQFHPTALRDGKSPLFLLSEALRGEGAYLIKRKAESGKREDKKEDRFMGDYDERMELAPRDIVARAIFNEQQKDYKVYLDIRYKGKKFLQKRFPNIYKELNKRGFDLSAALVPVTPAAHFSCGGVETDLYGRTNINNLFAYGEVACSGVHGANRLASNSLLESVVFPLRLKRCISELSSDVSSPFTSEESWRARQFADLPATIRGVFRFSGDSSPALSVSIRRLRKNLQQLMWEKVGIVRKKKDLKGALRQIKQWEKDLERLDCPGRELLELKNMILAGRLITKAAIKRRKSLGAHFMVS